MRGRPRAGPGWTAPPPRPLSYPAWQRCADVWHGWRDGRHKIPTVPDTAREEMADATERQRQLVVTAQLEVLGRRCRDQINAELVRWNQLAGAAPSPAELAVELPKLQEDMVAVERERQAARQPPDELALKERRSAERDRPDAVVRARRLADHQRRLRAAEDAYAAAWRTYDDAHRRLTRAADQQRRLHVEAAARARRIHEHTWRRIATYWQQLVRSHDKGPELTGLLRPVGPELPGWAQDDEHDDGGDRR